MFEKLRPKAQEWLYSTEFREMDSLISGLSQQIDLQLGKNKTVDEYLLDNRRIHLARLLGNARGFDYGLTAAGEEVKQAVDKIKGLLHDEAFNRPADKQLVCLLSNLYLAAKQNKHQLISIELDIKSCHPTMAYAEIGIDWYGQSNNDIYEQEGVAEWPRDLVKKCISTLFNAKSRQSAISSLNNKQRKEGIVEDAGMVPYKGWATNLVNDCFNSFVDLQPLFYKERGNHFMYKEGNICMAIIEACLEQNIPVLTLHDSFICPTEYSDELRLIISEAFRDEVNARCIVE